MKRLIQHVAAVVLLDLSAGLLLTSVALADEPQTQITGPANAYSPIVLGAGAFTIPVYPGSGAVELRPAPIIDVTFWNRLFIRSGTGAGAYLWHQRDWNIGVSIDADFLHRYEVDDGRPQGLGNVGKTARSNIFITRRCSWIEATMRLSTDIGGEGHGNVVDLELARSQSISPQLSIGEGVQTSWTNKQYMRTFFGVGAQQSARSGLPAFSPDGGISSGRLFFSVRYEVRPRWLVGGQAYVGRLFGDAADSPITQKRSSAGAGVFLTYRVR